MLSRADASGCKSLSQDPRASRRSIGYKAQGTKGGGRSVPRPTFLFRHGLPCLRLSNCISIRNVSCDSLSYVGLGPLRAGDALRVVLGEELLVVEVAAS